MTFLWRCRSTSCGGGRAQGARGAACSRVPGPRPRPYSNVVAQARRPRRPLRDHPDDEDEEDEEEEPLSRAGDMRWLAAEVEKQGHDLESDWNGLSGRIISTTTGAAKVASPTLDSGERPIQLMRPPSNPLVDRLRREEYEPPQRRRLFSRDDDDYEGDYLGTSSYTSSSDDEGDTRQRLVADAARRLASLPPVQFGETQAGVSGVGQAPSRPPNPASGVSSTRSSWLRRPGSGGDASPQVSEREREEQRLEDALKKAFKQSKMEQQGATAVPALKRPDPARPKNSGPTSAARPSATPVHSPAPKPGSSSSSSSAWDDDGLPLFGAASAGKPNGRPAAAPPSKPSGSSSVLLSVASSMRDAKRVEEEHADFEAQLKSLMKQNSSGAKDSTGQGPARPQMRKAAPATLADAGAAAAGLRAPPPPMQAPFGSLQPKQDVKQQQVKAAGAASPLFSSEVQTSLLKGGHTSGQAQRPSLVRPSSQPQSGTNGTQASKSSPQKGKSPSASRQGASSAAAELADDDDLAAFGQAIKAAMQKQQQAQPKLVRPPTRPG